MTPSSNETLERIARRIPIPEPAYERMLRRRDRKRRNQRIAAGVVGIAVFVAAVWIVTSMGSLDRSETPAVSGPAETGPAVTDPVETAPPPAPASPPPDVVVQQGRCSDGAKFRLELTDIGDRIEVRYEVHRSQPGYLWNIRMWHNQNPLDSHSRVEIWRGTRVASESGDFAVVRHHRDTPRFDGFGVSALDPASSQGCWGGASILD